MSRFKLSVRITALTLAFAGFAIGMGFTKTASAQLLTYAESGAPEDPGLGLLQESPHDIIYFTPEAGGGWAKTRLMTFREMPSVAAQKGTLRFQILGIESDEFIAKWKDIDRIDFWETRLEREVAERIAREDFVGAYPFLSILIRDYPRRPGLKELRCDFLWRNAIQRARGDQRAESLAMLEELHRYDSRFKQSNVLKAISGITNGLMDSMVEEGELDGAQQLLARLKSDYADYSLDAITKWDDEFLKMALEKRTEAIAAVRAKDYRTARRLARESLYLKPDIENGVELVKKIDEIYPLITVGVLQAARVYDPVRLDNWAARRTGRLLYRNLFEIQGAAPEGGEYDFLFGDTETNPDRTELELQLETDKLPSPLNRIEVDVLADRIAQRALPDSDTYFSPWAASVVGIGIDGPQRVRCLLRRPHVLPTCLLQLNVDASWFGGEVGGPTGDYFVESLDDNETRFMLTDEARRGSSDESKPREIVEVRCQSGSDAVSKLLSGEVDVLDQLFPADAIALKQRREIKVVEYPLPTIHMLVPCSDHAFIQDKNFRRALLYGINRDDILNGELLENKRFDGCRVLSGPFPAGLSQEDPLGYAYDASILPRPFEPSLAKLLKQLSINLKAAEAERKKEPPPTLEKIRLAFPADNLSRVACEAIKSQWQLIGLEVELVQLPIGETYPAPDTADLVYTSAAIWEPIIDARRLLGPNGLAKSEDQLVGLGLRRLEEALNWKDVRDRLLDLHAISHHELPVLPLWQMVESFAYRRSLTGMGNRIVSLYQNAGNWRLEH
ncbi:ABC transporter substrate-binding protein [Rhodopirellula sp. MGV]|uniref:ABC transporter substrate-binding protein n=1 Tax=Rhodopirellula sp. MGV TaxID=2023130 RepID=UPI000B9782DC|nr:ABC transporter substrate-binding protein [Rhodopirellula sp. MGV]OYP35987.1 peptide ABC transporter substrate-binding protein [Rhodopirellula sp. MGV]PNY36656.1 peptide ABC transporter substrate-binding protein [Rhodopirellula baltica]